MASISVYDPLNREAHSAVAAVCIHGFYPSTEAARSDALRLAREQKDVHSYIVEACMQWFPVQEPVKGSGVEEDEISAPQNDDPENGRMGSVCDLLRSAALSEPAEKADVGPNVKPGEPVFDAMPKKGRSVQNQQKQLDELLECRVVKKVENVIAYADLRTKVAWLNAFRRKLKRLIDESKRKQIEAVTAIKNLDALHPEYKDSYRQNYDRALKQSGIATDGVPFMQFLAEGVDGEHEVLADATCP